MLKLEIYRRKPRAGLCLALAMLGIGMSALVTAGDDSASMAAPDEPAKENSSAAGVDEVVVTAQRREERLNNVAIAVNAFSGAQLDRLGMHNSNDIVSFAPGVYLSSDTGGQNLKFTIRGVAQNDFLDAAESPVAVYVDDGYVAAQQGQVFGLFDLDRVEILKGPQGTLFGRNATGGLVQFISRKPKIGQDDGYAEVTYGSYNQARFEGAKSFSVSDAVAVRGAVLFSGHDAVLKNSYPGKPGADNEDLRAGRLQVLLAPTDRVNVTLSGSAALSQLDTGGYETQGIVPVFDANGRWVNSVLASPTETRAGIGPGGVAVPQFGITTRPTPGGNLFGYKEADPGNFQADYNFANANANRYATQNGQAHVQYNVSDSEVLTSITDYKNFTKVAALDVDASPINQFEYMADARTQTLSQEINLSHSAHALNWLAGLYYLHIDNHTLQGLTYPADSIINMAGSPNGYDLVTTVHLKTDSYSVFGQLDYKLSDTLTLVGGARLIEEKKDYFFSQNAYVNLNVDRIENTVLAFGIPQPADANPYARKFSQTLWAGKLQLEYRPVDNWLLYGGVNRGVKAGSVNGPLADGSMVTASQLVYKPEVLWAYESGFKIHPSGSPFGVNGSVYYYDYKDYQVFTFVNVSGLVSNENASIKGAELEITARPFSGLSAMVSGSYVDATVEHLQYAPGLYRDVRPVYTPREQISNLVRYELPVGNGQFAVQAEGSYVGSRYSNLRNFDAHRLGAYYTQGFRLSWTNATDAWTVSAYVNNAFNRRYVTELFDLGTLCGCTNTRYGEPRWFGGSVQYHF